MVVWCVRYTDTPRIPTEAFWSIQISASFKELNGRILSDSKTAWELRIKQEQT